MNAVSFSVVVNNSGARKYIHCKNPGGFIKYARLHNIFHNILSRMCPYYGFDVRSSFMASEQVYSMPPIQLRIKSRQNPKIQYFTGKCQCVTESSFGRRPF